MFAFGMYDGTSNASSRPRPTGEKPLFYRHATGVFAFASELKALMADRMPTDPGPGAFEHYLTYGLRARAMCMLAGSPSSPRGHALTYDSGQNGFGSGRIWTLPEPGAEPRGRPRSWSKSLESLLVDSVR